MERWRGKVAVVTGASAGIGAAISRLLAEKGMTVIGCARNIAKIDSLSQELAASHCPGKLISTKCDVRNEDDIKDMFKMARTQFGGVDVCVNNAGLAHNAPLLTGGTDHWRDMLEINVLGLCVVTREYMAQMKERGTDEGHIIHISSLAAHRVGKSPLTHFYCATKHAVKALTEGMRQELREMQSNIKVTSISPGLVRTEFLGRSTRAEDVEAKKADYEKLVLYGNVMEPEDIASSVVYTLSTPARMEVHDMVIHCIGDDTRACKFV